MLGDGSCDLKMPTTVLRDLKLGWMGGGRPGFFVCIVCLECLGMELCPQGPWEIIPRWASPGAQDFRVFLWEGKSIVFRLRNPIKTGIAETGSGSGCMDNPKEG